MSGRFADKVAIITGSSFGIGRETALLFAKEGAKVTVTGRDAARLDGTKQALLAAGVPASNFVVIPADITSAQGQDELISGTLERFGKINVLVNNAGASIPDKEKRLGVAQGIDTLENDLRLNLRSVVEMTQKARPHLAAAKGDIVNVSSVVALNFGWARNPYYPVAKAALDQYTRSCAIDLIPEGIRVNTVNPGVVVTGFHGAATGLDEAAANKFYDDMGADPHSIPVGFSGRPNHIAQAIAFLADRKTSEYIIGQNIIADGGTSLVLGIHGNNQRMIDDAK